MAEYIEREELRKRLLEDIEFCGEPDAILRPIAYSTIIGLKGALSYISTLPTADVVEVKHGEWIILGDCDFQCPECGFRFTSPDDISMFKFCRCGLKMDKKEGAEE